MRLPTSSAMPEHLVAWEALLGLSLLLPRPPSSAARSRRTEQDQSRRAAERGRRAAALRCTRDKVPRARQSVRTAVPKQRPRRPSGVRRMACAPTRAFSTGGSRPWRHGLSHSLRQSCKRLGSGSASSVPLPRAGRARTAFLLEFRFARHRDGSPRGRLQASPPVRNSSPDSSHVTRHVSVGAISPRAPSSIFTRSNI